MRILENLGKSANLAHVHLPEVLAHPSLAMRDYSQSGGGKASVADGCHLQKQNQQDDCKEEHHFTSYNITNSFTLDMVSMSASLSSATMWNLMFG
jgi:hypothetical protein